MMQTVRGAAIPEPPSLKHEIRGGVIRFGHVEFRGGHERYHRLTAEGIYRLPDDSGLKSLDKIVVSERPVKRTVGITRVRTEYETNELVYAIQRITFYRDLLEHLSDQAVLGAIAHEFAHVWLNHHEGPDMGRARERAADRLARKWGFGPELDALKMESYTDWTGMH